MLGEYKQKVCVGCGCKYIVEEQFMEISLYCNKDCKESHSIFINAYDQANVFEPLEETNKESRYGTAGRDLSGKDEVNRAFSN